MRKINKMYCGFLLIFVLFIGIVSTMINVKGVEYTEYSDELEYESFNALESLTNWYDGVETFYYDTIGQNPITFYVSGTATVQDYSNHKSTLRLSSTGTATYYFERNTYEKDTDISFWLYSDWSLNNEMRLYIYFNNSEYVYLEFIDWRQWDDIMDYNYYRDLKISDDSSGFTEEIYSSYGSAPVPTWEHYEFQFFKDGNSYKTRLVYDFTNIIGHPITKIDKTPINIKNPVKSILSKIS